MADSVIIIFLLVFTTAIIIHGTSVLLFILNPFREHIRHHQFDRAIVLFVSTALLFLKFISDLGVVHLS